MKKIIVFLAVFALLAGSLFAVDLGGAVNGSVTLFSGSSVEDSDITSSATMNRIRIEGAGQTDDGVYGGWLRMEGDSVGGNGLAWWKPLDFLKIIIGGNPDGHWGKEGITGWGLSQTAYDVDVTNSQNNVWGGTGIYGWNRASRNAFFGGDGNRALRLEITPLDILAVKVAVPFFDGGKFEDVLKDSVAQVDLNLPFGNIALTYRGAPQYVQKGDGATIFGYLGLSAIDNLGVDVGVGIQLENEDKTSNPIWAGLGLKVGLSDLFQIRLRAYAGFGGEDSDPFQLTADVNPYLILSDTLRVSFTVGIGIEQYKDEDMVLGFNVNPYIEVGQEWGPKFLAGFMLTNNGVKDAKDKTETTWKVAIGIQSSF